MKELVNKYNLIDFFVSLFPGAILCLSLLFWLDPKFESSFWGKEFLVQFLVIFLLLLFPYILSSILNSYSRIYNGIIHNRIYNRIVARSSRKWWWWLLKIINKFLDLILDFFSIKNSKKIEIMIIELKMQISENIDDISDKLPAKIESWMLSGLSSWDWLQICRILLANYTKDNYEYILAEAESLHRRFLFSMDISLALSLIGLQALLRLIIFTLSIFLLLFERLHETLPNVNIFFLVVIAVISFWSSFEMRRIANNMYFRELYLIACLKKENSNSHTGEIQESDVLGNSEQEGTI